MGNVKRTIRYLANCPLPITHYPLPITHYPLPTTLKAVNFMITAFFVAEKATVNWTQNK